CFADRDDRRGPRTRRGRVLVLSQLPKRTLSLGSGQTVCGSGDADPAYSAVELATVGRPPASVVRPGRLVELTGPVTTPGRHRRQIFSLNLADGHCPLRSHLSARG